jgi:RecB family exonuclease
VAPDLSKSLHNGLALVLGPANSGKIGRVLRWWEERLPQGALLVAPTASDARRLSLRMARRTGGLLGQEPALTFDGLVRLILERPPRYATDLERALIAARLLRDTPLEALAPSANLPGVLIALSRLLEQLGESGKEPQELDRILVRWGAADPRAASLAGDIRRLVEAYVQTLSALGLTDRPAAVRDATAAVRGATQAAREVTTTVRAAAPAMREATREIWEAAAATREATPEAAGWQRPVAFYGFTSFTAGQRALIEELSRRAEVVVAFTHDSVRGETLRVETPRVEVLPTGPPPTEPAGLDFSAMGFSAADLSAADFSAPGTARPEPTGPSVTGPSRVLSLTTSGELSWWKAKAAQVIEVESRTGAYTSPAIAYLERFFMDDAGVNEAGRSELPPAFVEGRGVRFLLASGRRAEVELAAEQIADLIRGGLEPGQIAVIVRHVRPWSGLVGQVFDSCGIPYQVDDRCTLRETGLGHAFLKALRGVVLNDADALLAYLRSPYSEITLEEVASFERAYRQGVPRGAWVLAKTGEALGLRAIAELWDMVEHDAGEPGDGVGSDAAAGGALKAAPGTPGEGPGLRFSPVAAEKLARGMLVSGMRSGLPGDRFLEEDARAFRALCAAFGAMARLAAGDDHSVEGGSGTGDTGGAGVGRAPEAGDSSGWLDPGLVLRSLGQAAVAGGGPENEGAVQVLSVRRARARRFQAVLILGLVEGEFPGRPDTPSLLTPAQRVRLDSLGGGLLPVETDQEAALFASAISRPWRLLFLSARDAEDDGSECMPSLYWQSAKDLLGAGPSDLVRRTLADQVFAPHKASSWRHYLRACAACGRAPHLLAAETRRAAAPRPWPGLPSRLADPAVLEELRSLECFSPSGLEAYASCPFRWFVEQVVGIEETEAELDGRAVGQLLHRVLSATYQTLASSGLLPLRAERVEAAERTAAAVIDDATGGDECPGTPAERRLTARRLRQMARNLFLMEVIAGSALTLAETEMWVGRDAGVDVGGFKVKGRIDRVDATEDGKGLLVLDYKTGSIPANKDIGTGEGLQLPLYLMALAAERPTAEVVGGAYLSLRDRDYSGVVAERWQEVLGSGKQGFRPRNEEDMEGLFRNTREVAEEAIAGMRAGLIAPRADRKCPAWCGLGPACRSRREGYRR